MSQVKIQGNPSGSGTFTIAAPNSNSDRTLNLPDGSGTINTSGAPNEVPAGSVSAPAIYPTGDTNTGIFFPAADTIAFAEGGVEAGRFDSSGNLLVNTTTNTNSSRVVVNGTIESTSGGVRFPDGTTQTSAAVSGQMQFQLFTATGTTTWTAPAGVTRVRATVIGGGGGSCSQSGGSGGGGGIAIGQYTVVPGTGYSITVGAGGVGVSSGTAGAGGTSSFASFCSATGGGGATNFGSGANGSGSSGNIRNTTMGLGAFGPPAATYFGGSLGQSSSAAAQVWSVSSVFAAGSYGSTGATWGGGLAGIVFLEWVG